MTTGSRQLVVIRHAKAADGAPDLPDHDRPLVPEGHRDAEALGRWLKAEGIVVDLVLCSTASRARETWAGVVQGSGLGALVEHDQRIYNASVDTLVEVLQDEGRSARSIALVGHAPGIPGLAAALSEGHGEPGPQESLRYGYPTATAAVLGLDGKWKDLAAGSGTLTAVHTARADVSD